MNTDVISIRVDRDTSDTIRKMMEYGLARNKADAIRQIMQNGLGKYKKSRGKKGGECSDKKKVV